MSGLILNRAPALLLLATLVLAAGPRPARAHCDTLSGPVAADARTALTTGDPSPALKWIRAEDEPEAEDAFRRSRAVMANGGDSRALATLYFIETVVRLHRASEGEPFTGLKPAAELPPLIALADQAVDTGASEVVIRRALKETEAELRTRFAAVREARKRRDDSVPAGREFVARYVALIHYLERLLPAEPGGHGE